MNNKDKSRSANAFNLFKKRLRSRDLPANDIILAIRDYLNNRLCLEMGSLTPDEVFEILISKYVKEDNAELLRDFLKKCEDAVYTGKGNEPGSVDISLVDLIKKIEREIV